jgi:S1-C subfamily serine protease
MPLDIKILSGARAGQSERFDKPTIVVGRASQTDLRFDPNQDLDVSGKHAEIRGGGGGSYELHDAGSTNGTYVNGVKVAGSAKLKPGDHVKFGKDGPEVEVQFRLSQAVKKVGSTEERVAFAVKQQTAGLRRMLFIALGVVAVGLTAAYFIGQRAASAQVERLRQQLAENDARLKTFQSSIPGDSTLANELLRRLKQLQDRQRGATSDDERSRMLSEITELENQIAGLQGLGLPSINTRNAPAVAIIVSKVSGKPFAGTAFGLTKDGLLLTNRHNVRSESGKDTTTAIAVKFRDTREWLQARLVRISEDPDVDLALIQMVNPGPYPTVVGVQSKGDNAGEGASVAIIGFPFGYETAQEAEGSRTDDFIAKTTLNGGTVSKRTSAVLQIDSFVGHGSSGSPVFSSRGTVVGVVWGGPRDAGGRIVYAVPPDKIVAFLGPEYRSLIKD